MYVALDLNSGVGSMSFFILHIICMCSKLQRKLKIAQMKKKVCVVIPNDCIINYQVVDQDRNSVSNICMIKIDCHINR